MDKDSLNGLLVIDKPGGMTSRDVVNRAQGWFPRGTRIGHTGTLDPLATGVLVLCIGRTTRLAEYVQDMAKVYRARLRLGATSTTDDADGDILPLANATLPDPARLVACLEGFLGTIDQVPPAFSAAKVSGHRAYRFARAGEPITLEPRRVAIYRITLLSYEESRLEIEVECGRGTYVRSLARDLGQRLACGAYVEALRRTRVGPFQVTNAVPLDLTAQRAHAALLPSSDAVSELPCIELEPELITRLCQGQALPSSQIRLGMASLYPESRVAVFDQAKQLVAVARINSQKLLVPEKVLL